MDVEKHADDVRLDADHQKLDNENFIDDDEVTLHRRRRDTDVTDIPGSDVHDELDTQREDWLLRTESLHGARPRWITRERPPLIDDHTGVMDQEAEGGTGGRQVEQQGFQAPLLTPERQILMEEKVITPPRGGRPAPVTQVPPGGVRAVPQIFTGVRPREGGPDRHKDVESLVDRLLDTVARMQVDLADLRAENRMLRIPRVPQVTVHLDRRRSQRQKCHGLMEQRVGNNILKQGFDAIVSSNGWDNDTTVLQLFSHLEGDALNVALLVPLPRRLSRTGLVGALSAHYGSLGRLADYRRQFEKTTRIAGEDPSILAT